MLKALVVVALAAGSGLAAYRVIRVRETPRAIPQRCVDARMDSEFVLRWMLSPGTLNRQAASRAYDYVLWEQRSCTLFTAPIELNCNDDGCRAAALLVGQVTIPIP